MAPGNLAVVQALDEELKSRGHEGLVVEVSSLSSQMKSRWDRESEGRLPDFEEDLHIAEEKDSYTTTGSLSWAN